LGKWVRIELDAHWGSLSHVLVRLDAVQIADLPLSSSCAASDSASVNIGASVDNGEHDGGTSLDNVVVDLEP